MPKSYIEHVIAETDITHDKGVTYEDFLDMWRQELEDKKINAWRKISRQRTVSKLVEEMLTSSTDGEEDSDDVDSDPLSHHFLTVAEN